MPKVTYERDGLRLDAEVESMKPETLVYLIQYGWSQSLQDSLAGRAKKVREEMAGRDEPEILAAIKADAEGTLRKRADAILAGTIGASPGKATLLPGRSPSFRAVAKEWLAAAAKAAGKKLPPVASPAFGELLTKYATAKAAEIQAEADRRAAPVDVDLDF